MIKKKIRMRKEVVRCDSCKQPKDFMYISDFVYGQRLVYFDNNINLAFINLLKDDVYSEYIDMVKKMLNERNITCLPEELNTFVEKSFGVTCDMIYGKQVDFSVGQRRCLCCGSTKFERNMIEPESTVETELPIVSHNEWNLLDHSQKQSIILSELQKEGVVR